MRQRFVTFIVLGLILVLLAEWNVRSASPGAFSRLNDFWLEFCIGNAGDRISNPAVTVVRINDGYEPLRIGDDNSGAEDGRLSRLDYATILGLLGKLDPKSVAFLPTPTFDESLVLNQTDIVPLKDAAMQLPRFLVAANVSHDGEEATEANPIDYDGIRVEGDASEILAFTRTVQRPEEQLLANSDPAFKTIESAPNLIQEEEIRIPLVAAYRDKVVPSLVLAAVAHHAGVPLDEVVLDLTGKRPVVRVGEEREIPVARDGTFAVPARAGIRRGMSSLRQNEEGEVERVLHFTSLTVDELAYTGQEEDEVAKRILASLQDKFRSLGENLVLIGFDRTPDRRITTAAGSPLSETLLLSHAIAAIQSGRFIEWWPAWGRGVAMLAIAAIAAFLFRLPRSRFLPLWVVASLLFFGACVLIFRSTLTWTPPFFAFALFALMLLLGLLIPANSARKDTEEA